MKLRLQYFAEGGAQETLEETPEGAQEEAAGNTEGEKETTFDDILKDPKWYRSTTVPYFDVEWGRSGKRTARDEKTGKTYYVPLYTVEYEV